MPTNSNDSQDRTQPPDPTRWSGTRIVRLEDEGAAESVRAFDPKRELAGAVFTVPDRQWGFASATSVDHPGACVRYQPAQRQGILLKGTDAENVRSPRGCFFVAATPGNGLRKETGFALAPRYFRLHRLRLYYPERHLGRLDDGTLHDLHAELTRLHGEE